MPESAQPAGGVHGEPSRGSQGPGAGDPPGCPDPVRSHCCPMPCAARKGRRRSGRGSRWPNRRRPPTGWPPSKADIPDDLAASPRAPARIRNGTAASWPRSPARPNTGGPERVPLSRAHGPRPLSAKRDLEQNRAVSCCRSCRYVIT